MQKENENQENIIEGIVIEALPNTMFRVVLDEGKEEKIAYLSGRMKHNRIRVLVGDKVLMEVDRYGGKPKITRRL